jgi:hypothetical protein
VGHSGREGGSRVDVPALFLETLVLPLFLCCTWQQNLQALYWTCENSVEWPALHPTKPKDVCNVIIGDHIRFLKPQHPRRLKQPRGTYDQQIFMSHKLLNARKKLLCYWGGGDPFVSYLK